MQAEVFVMRVMIWLVIVGVVIGSSATTTAEQKFPPDKFVNLQVFPKDARPDVVITAMKNFTRSLGVRCQLCHVGEEGLPLEKFDFPSDAKPQKNIARAMMRMTAEINGTLTTAIPDIADRGQQVTCYTCHRGTGAGVRQVRQVRRVRCGAGCAGARVRCTGAQVHRCTGAVHRCTGAVHRFPREH